MADMYKVKLTNGRIVGPIDYNQIYKLIEEELLKGEELIQAFPSGHWTLLKEVFSKEFDQILNKSNYSEDPLFEKLDQLKKGFLKKKVINEDDTFFMEKEEPEDSKTTPEVFLGGEEIEESKDSLYQELDMDINKDDEGQHLDDDPLSNLKTSIIDKNEIVDDFNSQLTEEDVYGENKEGNNSASNSEELELVDSVENVKIEQTKVVSKSKKNKIEETKVIQPKYDYKPQSKSEIEVDPDMTEVVSSAKVVKSLNQEKVKANEKLIDEHDQKLLKETEPDASSKPAGQKKKGRKLSLGVILLLVFVAILFFPTDDKKTDFDLKPKKLKFYYPIEKSVLNSKLAQELYQKGKELFLKEGKESEIASIKYFLRSLEEKFQKNPSLAFLMIIYTKHHKEFIDIKENYDILHKMAEMLKMDKYKPINTLAIAHYYRMMGKNSAAIFLIKNSNIVNKNSSLRNILSLYLHLLLEEGELNNAKDVFERLTKVQEGDSLNLESYYAIFSYQKFNSLNDEANKTLKTALSKYPYEHKLVFEQTNLYLLENKISDMKQSLNYIKDNIVDLFISDLAQYFMYKGIVKLQEEGVAPAQKYFQQSLRFQDSPWLRSKLNNLNEDGFKEESLVKDNKIKHMIYRSKTLEKSGDWNRAFKLTSEALFIDKDNIEAHVYMNQLLLKKNLFKQTLINLQKKYKIFPKSVEINAALLEAYIASYQVKNAKKLITTIASSSFKDNPIFFPIFAKFYNKIGDLENSLYWLDQSLTANPLDDDSLAKKSYIFFLSKKFDKAKEFLNKAIELNPTEMRYYLQYAEILMEYDSIDMAIGYLINLRDKKFPNDPIIKGEIGIYYLKNGQIKYFRDIKKELEKDITQPKNLHRYLIKVYQIDRNYKKIIESAKKILEIDPLDIEVKAILAKAYFNHFETTKDKNSIEESLRIFKDLEKSLETYPNVQYYIGRGYYIIDEFEEALKYANKEISFNPNNDLGYLLKAEVFIKKENYNEAENAFKLAQRYNANSIEAIMGIASINFKRGQFDVALSLYQKAMVIVRSASKKAEIYKLQGDVYRQLGQSKLAIESYKLFQEIEPDSKYNRYINDFIKMSQ